jgi:hypothetical protein
MLLISFQTQHGYTEDIDFLGVYESSFYEDMFGDKELSEKAQ